MLNLTTSYWPFLIVDGMFSYFCSSFWFLISLLLSLKENVFNFKIYCILIALILNWHCVYIIQLLNLKFGHTHTKFNFKFKFLLRFSKKKKKKKKRKKEKVFVFSCALEWTLLVFIYRLGKKLTVSDIYGIYLYSSQNML